MKMTTRSILALIAATLMACSGGTDDPPAEDTGADVGGGDTDASPDSPEPCPEGDPPLDGDVCDCEGDEFTGRVDLCDRSCVCEFGFWACEQECDEPEPPRLEWVGDFSVDEQTGDGDAEINPGETWSISGSVRLVNGLEGGDAATVRLRGTSPHVEFTDATASFENLTDEAVTFTLPFSVRESAPAATVEIQVDAFAGVIELTERIEIAIVAPATPALSFTSLEFQDDTGGPIARVDAGSTIRVVATLRNTGTIAAEGVEATVAASSSAITGGDAIAVGILAPGANRTVEFEVTVADDPDDLSPEVTVAATATNAATATRTANAELVPPDNLVLESSEWEAGETEGTWEFVVTFENAGRSGLSGITWNAIDYVSADPSDEPFIEFAMGFELPPASAPTTIAAGATASVVVNLTVDESTPAAGRLMLRATSSSRTHRWFGVDVTRPE